MKIKKTIKSNEYFNWGKNKAHFIPGMFRRNKTIAKYNRLVIKQAFYIWF